MDENESPSLHSKLSLLPQSSWFGLFTEALYRITQEVNPGFGIQREALDHVESLIIRLMYDIAAKKPFTISDVEQHIEKTFPAPLNVWAVKEAQDVLGKSSRRHRDRSAVLPFQRIHLMLRENLGYKVDTQITLFIVSILEYIATDILKLTGNYVKNIRHSEITLQDLKVAMRADNVLMDLFYHDSEDIPMISLNADDLVSKKVGSLSYEQTVKDLVHNEAQFLREVNMIILVFRRALFEAIGDRSGELDAIFSNISEIQEFTSKFLGFLEDTVEMCKEPEIPFVGNCFLEMAEGAEFEVYEKYVKDVLNPSCLRTLNVVLQKPTTIVYLNSQGNGFRLAVKYLLPKLLLGPVFHCLKYFEYLPVLIKLSACENDKYDLVQTESLLMLLKSRLEQKCSSLLKKKKMANQFDLRFIPGGSGRSALMKLQELQRNVDGWDLKSVGCSCVEFILEGKLRKCGLFGQKLGNTLLSAAADASRKNFKITDRYVFLFDSMIVLCKSTLPRRNASSSSATAPELRLKELFLMRKVEAIDHDDNDELKYAFEIRQRDSQSSIVLLAADPDEKCTWLAALLMLQTRSMLERMLDSHLEAEHKRIPLLVPSPEEYRFSEPDSEDNIVLEDYTSSSGIPVVRGATLLKLVERLTYHMYVDPKFVRTFLTTFRSFCAPSELLQLLIERFDIPDPSSGTMAAALLSETENKSNMEVSEFDSLLRESLKRLRKEYIQPVRIRVLNIIRQWIDHHWYDFDQDAELLANLKHFLKRIETVHTVVKWTRSLQNIIDRKLHPIEIARQITLLEFDLYRAVKPIELVGAAWTKKDKDKRSPQLLKLIQHSTKFTYWLEKCVVECGNLNERVAVMNRILEIMCIFQELNNFTGLIEIYGRLDPKLLKVFEEVKQILSDAHHKLIRERLRSINPPCVPFFGMYLTNIIFLEEGNPIFLKMPLSSQSSEADSTTHDCEKPTLISFAKCRKIADIITEIQMYQNQPYCLILEPSMRQSFCVDMGCILSISQHFFESLNPLQGFSSKNDLEAYLYNRSLEIEPKETDKPPNFAPLRKYSLKSPGIKPQKVSQHMKHKCASASPTMLFTPLIGYGRDRQGVGSSTSATLPLRRTPNTAPASPTFKETSIFAIVEINPGEQPKHVADVTEPSQRAFSSTQQPQQQLIRLEKRTRKHSHPMTLVNNHAGESSCGTIGCLAPPIPPRQLKTTGGSSTTTTTTMTTVTAISNINNNNSNSNNNNNNNNNHHHHHQLSPVTSSPVVVDSGGGGGAGGGGGGVVRFGFKSPMITTTTTMTIANNVTCNITNANTTTTIIGNTANTSATLSTCFRFPELKSSDLIDITEETTTVTCAAVSRPAIPPRNSSLAQSPKAITLPHPLRFISTLPVNTTTTTNTNTTTTTSLDESRYENREQLVSSTIVTRNKNKNNIKNIHIHNHNHNNNVKNVLVQPIAKVTPEPSSSSSMKREQVMEIITVGNSVKFPPPIPPKSSTKGGSGGGGGGGGGDTSTTPPPRPPKRVPVEKSDHAPPLPPKTYKQKQWPSKKMGNHFPK
ncbi:Son of sevenless -like protein 1 [Trichinella pseudospiralis]|uniref:Son of sevenless-like protein 1 n=1 Tax=Trichinella pseudospiralis TaxID=6337 RepID=A0A0V1IXT3_TRIPS|nr:Son of sevenless -like protein 1 [Trichinella pseudospiralis]